MVDGRVCSCRFYRRRGAKATLCIRLLDRAHVLHRDDKLVTGKTLKDPLCTLSLGTPPPETVSIEEFDAKIDAKTSKTANSSIDDIDEDFYGSESYNADEFDAEGFDEMNFNE